MKAMVIRRHGGIDEIRQENDYPDPRPVPGSVVVAVGATSLNYHDLFTLRGMPGIKVPMPVVMGIDIAGTVVEVGDDCGGWEPGDRVLIDPIDRMRLKMIGETFDGGLAQRVLVDHRQLIRLPDRIGFEQAAALPVAYGTAYRMMISRGRVARGEKVVILGASGGVGTCCVQLARMAGAEVVVCASTEAKLKRLAELGATHGINYATSDLVREVHRLYGKPRMLGSTAGADVVVNFTGGETWVPSMQCLKAGGRLLTCGATAGYDPKTDIRYIWTFELDIVGSNGWQRSDLVELLRLVETEQIVPVIDRVLPLERTREAFELIRERNIVGKVLLQP